MSQLSGTEKVSFYLIVILVKLSALVVEHTVQLLHLDRSPPQFLFCLFQNQAISPSPIMLQLTAQLLPTCPNAPQPASRFFSQ